jgi:hypothetical protein
MACATMTSAFPSMTELCDFVESSPEYLMLTYPTTLTPATTRAMEAQWKARSFLLRMATDMKAVKTTTAERSIWKTEA